jgi:predicted GNAT superfamily acetyltransferase
LSVRLPRAWFETAIVGMPVIGARRTSRLLGYLVSSSVAANAEVPLVRAMLEAYHGSAGAYVYGPICVEATERGRGVAGMMFADLRARLPGREGILFIRRDNAASLRAHTGMGMREVAGFDHQGTKFAVLSYIGS